MGRPHYPGPCNDGFFNVRDKINTISMAMSVTLTATQTGSYVGTANGSASRTLTRVDLPEGTVDLSAWIAANGSPGSNEFVCVKNGCCGNQWGTASLDTLNGFNLNGTMLYTVSGSGAGVHPCSYSILETFVETFNAINGLIGPDTAEVQLGPPNAAGFFVGLNRVGNTGSFCFLEASEVPLSSLFYSPGTVARSSIIGTHTVTLTGPWTTQNGLPETGSVSTSFTFA